MVIFKNVNQISDFIFKKRKNQKTIGFIPTMGALHDGHISLIKRSINQNDLTVCSIFVNPTQFNDAEDFKKYPITIENDIYLLEISGCDVLFLPSISEIYPDGIKNPKNYELGFIETILEGEFRPGHFQGVCQVVDRLLKIILPDTLYIGQKDYQQCMVIKKLLALTKVENIISIDIAPIIREPDGLAMSSRNKRLSPKERVDAPAISKVLGFIKEKLKAGNNDAIIREATNKLESSGFKVDYICVADAETLMPVNLWDGKRKVVALVAAFLGGVRLIDNLIIN